MDSAEMPAFTTQASLSTRIKVWWESLPLLTKSIFSLCVALYTAALLVGWDNLFAVCLGAQQLVMHLQLYRLLTGAFFHAGLLHLAFNMLAFLPIGSNLERTMGTFQLGWLILLLIAIGDGIYVGVSFVGAALGFPAMLSHCAVGLSGVIFGLIPVDIRASGGATRSVFGLFNVPSVWYPWALLVIWQILVPQSSLLGHLSGLIVGHLYAIEALRWATPTNETVQQWETTAPLLPRCVTYRGYIANTGSSGLGGFSSSIGDALLPTSTEYHQHSEGQMRSMSAMLATWMRGPWMPYPTGAMQVHSSNNGGSGRSDGPAPVSVPERDSQNAPTVGGQPTRLDPKSAAAAAAEARMLKTTVDQKESNVRPPK